MVAELDAELRGAGPVGAPLVPDALNRNKKAVDLLVRGIDGAVAVEHTTIESWPRQIEARARLMELFDQGGVLIGDVADAGHYIAVLDPVGLLEIPYRERPTVAPEMEAWIRSALPSVPWPHQIGVDHWVEDTLATTGLRVGLHRFTDSMRLVGPWARLVQVRWWIPAKLLNHRARRLAETVEGRFPKLLAAGPVGTRSVLVLEEVDIYSSAPFYVSEALQLAVGDRPVPDAIYLFDAVHGNPVATPIWNGQRWWHEHSFAPSTFSAQRCGEFNALR
jgi:hypothetical protein